MATAAVRGRRARLRLQSPQAISTAGVTDPSTPHCFNEVRNWTLTPTQEVIDASSCDSSGWNESIPGQRGWTFTAETVFASPNGNTGLNGVRQDIRSLMRLMFHPTSNRRLIFFELTMDKDPTSTSASTGQVWKAGSSGVVDLNDIAGHVENFRIGGRYDQIQLFDLTIRGNGDLAYSS